MITSRNGGYDQIECGPGFDIVVADAASLDVVDASCEVVRRGLPATNGSGF
ncbi:hypothetical protein [Streptomyces sp. NPDC051219]|uniref:hypothetical protein n=1 Tax=Streptomyces sp. NPDC051219 TaxID=3155283 RepID=UPI003416CF7E